MKILIDPAIFNYDKLDFLTAEELIEITNFTLLRYLSILTYSEGLALLLVAESYFTNKIRISPEHPEHTIMVDEFNHYELLRRYLKKNEFASKDMLTVYPLYNRIKWMPTFIKRIFVYLIEKYLGIPKYKCMLKFAKDPDLVKILKKFDKDEQNHVKIYEQEPASPFWISLCSRFFKIHKYADNIRHYYTYNRFPVISNNISWKAWCEVVKQSPFVNSILPK